MRVCVCFVALGWLSPARGFTTTSSRQTRTAVARHVSGTGWDNDNFLDSLGGNSEDQEEANDAYFGMSRYGRPEEQQQQAAPGFRGRQSPGRGPSANQFAMEAQDGYSKEYAQQFSQRQPNSMGPAHTSNPVTPQPTGGSPPQGAQGVPPPPTNIQQPGAPPDQYAQQLDQLSQQLQQLSQQQQQLLQNPQSAPPYGQPQQPPPQLDQPSAQAPAQNAFAQQLSFQQFLEQQHQQQQQPLPQQQPSQIGEGGSTDSLDRQDELPDAEIEGAVLTEEMKARVKSSHTPEEEASGGGELFRGMMERAKQRAAQQQTIVQQSMQQQQQPLQIPGNAMDLTVEEQARLFRDIMADRQQQAALAYQQQQPQAGSPSYAQQQLPTYPYGEQAPQPQFLPPGVGLDGRKVGRNRDADIISTSADVYFAQLKRDSSTRRLARDAGDNEKANAVFHDPSIQEIKGPAVNPFMVEQREKETDVLQSPPEEMLIFQEYSKSPNAQERSYSGINFKEKLAQKKAQRGDN